MAGAGYKLFNTGDVLLASEVNTYLQQQVTMVFANATARTSALSGVLAEGMMSYLQDTNTVEVYDGSNWVSVGNTGDITGITTGANSGLTGGVTSGTADLKVNFASKGQLAVGTGSGTTGFLNVGTNGHTLVADSSETTGLKWAAPAGGGKVLQVVNATYNTETQNNTNTFADSGLTATITPSSATSKILVFVSQSGIAKTDNTRVAVRLLRGATELIIFEATAGNTGDTSIINVGGGTTTYLDSPNTTSATTYKTQFRSVDNTTYARVQQSGAASSITLMEIGA